MTTINLQIPKNTYFDNAFIPENGLILPLIISIPNLKTKSKLSIWAQQYGINLAPSIEGNSTLRSLKDDIAESLLSIGYIRDSTNADMYKITNIINLLKYFDENIFPKYILLNYTPDKYKETINLIIKKGYFINNMGYYERPKICNSKTISELFNTEYIGNFISSLTPKSINITQQHLGLFTVTYNELKNMLGSEFNTVDDFCNYFAMTYKLATINSNVIKLMFILHFLKKMSVADMTILKKRLGINSSIVLYIKERLNLIPQYYEKVSVSTNFPRIKLHANASISDVLSGGFDFHNEIHANKLRTFLVTKGILPFQLDSYIDLCKTYPLFFKMLEHWTKYCDNTLTEHLIEIYYAGEILTKSQILYTFATNCIIPNYESDSIKTRRIKLNECTPAIQQTILNFYDGNIGFGHIEQILQHDEHPLENFIIKASNPKLTNYIELAAQIGKYIPEFLTLEERRIQCLENLHVYKYIHMKPIDAPSITNVNITNELQSTIPFEDRFDSLIEKYKYYTDMEILSVLNQTDYVFQGRFILCEYIITEFSRTKFNLNDKIDIQHTTNIRKETLQLTPLTELLPPYITYGNKYSYMVHELDDFKQAFIGEPIRLINMSYTNGSEYTIPEISQLLNVLTRYVDIVPTSAEDVYSIINLLNRGISERTKIHEKLPELDDFLRKNPHEKELFKNFINDVFLMGMYCRRWKGQGHPFPIYSGETKGKSLEWQCSVTKYSASIMEYINNYSKRKIDILNTIYEINYHETTGDIIHTKRKLVTQLVDVIKGHECVRVASRDLIQTAYYLNVIIFNTTFENVNITEIQAISGELIFRKIIKFKT